MSSVAVSRRYDFRFISSAAVCSARSDWRVYSAAASCAPRREFSLSSSVLRLLMPELISISVSLS